VGEKSVMKFFFTAWLTMNQW